MAELARPYGPWRWKVADAETVASLYVQQSNNDYQRNTANVGVSFIHVRRASERAPKYSQLTSELLDPVRCATAGSRT